eukprot:CAMPEP_0182932388 /NCGR_PEP_ID=MMETSP0105_2-20130417/31160_1 /TAXON_ID=81532 ORGANISM="Acanthoeca-like sp., Strain 10tr" /NCGR_SAMPLE_ID=MMETSP0105_2 /ASSEMBLY_ACC=CAM_ASM_000205 /LENGTH=51 /DNA_ID=CAMNT_0025070969 /DNA_START=147 /DNA_END=298 /DNA_ORIENTATION=+
MTSAVGTSRKNSAMPSGFLRSMHTDLLFLLTMAKRGEVILAFDDPRSAAPA